MLGRLEKETGSAGYGSSLANFELACSSNGAAWISGSWTWFSIEAMILNMWYEYLLKVHVLEITFAVCMSTLMY